MATTDTTEEQGSTLPILHMNGTSRDALLEQRCDVGAAIRAALEALTDMWPNARDYYPEPGRYERARAEHQRRYDMLDTLYRELQAEAEAISDMEGGRP